MKNNHGNRKERKKRLAARRRVIANGRASGKPVAYEPGTIKRRGRAALRKGNGRGNKSPHK
jgi:hypothetical protein